MRQEMIADVNKSRVDSNLCSSCVFFASYDTDFRAQADPSESPQLTELMRFACQIRQGEGGEKDGMER